MSDANTSLTLLDQLCRNPQEATWDRLVEIYAPLLRGWLRSYDVQDSDADDLVQDVLMVVLRELPRFQHNHRQGAFRAWLRGIVVNRLRNFWRARDKAKTNQHLWQRLEQLEDQRSGLTRQWDAEHDRYLAHRLLEQIEPRFSPTTLAAFRRLALDGADADDVALELGLTLNAVFTAKSRVLRELRRVGRGLID
jgi:RNA polymerase sigma-70 factor (ECF subfamily)